MTDKEYVNTLPNVSNKELIERIEWYGCDPYYNEAWSATMDELKRRLEVTE